MKALKTIASLTLLAAIAPSAWGDSSGADQYVKTISINASKPYPVFEVESDGESYTQAKSLTSTWHARVTGVCRATKHVHFASYNLNTTQSDAGLLAHRELDVSGPKRKTFGHNIAVDVQWEPNSTVRNRALNACRDYMQDAKSEGKSLVDILGEDKRLVVDSGLYGNFNLNCADGLSAGVKKRYDEQPIEVICKGSPVTVGLVPGKINLFQLTQVSFAPAMPSYTGVCPKDFPFTGQVRTNGGEGQFRYRFRNHRGVATPWKTVQGQKGKTLYPIAHAIKLQDIEINENPNLPNQVQSQQGGGMAQLPQMGIKENPWVTLEVQNLANQKEYSRKAGYKFTCTQPPKMQLGVIPGGGQGQGQDKADLIVLDDTFRLGSKVVAPGSNGLTIGAEEATLKTAGLCQFRMQVGIRNQGEADAQPAFTTRVAEGNKTLHFAATPLLPKGQSRTLSGNVKLPPGNSVLLVKTDHADKVDESNEGNNLARFMITVKGDCDRPAPARPQANVPPRGAPPAEAPARPIR